MRTMMVCAFFATAMFIVACAGSDPVPYATDKDGVGQVEQDLSPVDDTGLPDTTDPEPNDDGTEPVDDGTVVPDTDIGGSCKLDSECAPNICVKAKCALGCTGDGDCANYPNTTCNTKLGRCLNTAASEGACNETNCPSGCCYAEKGFAGLKCLTTGALNTCGICAQGEVYMEGKQCVAAACKVGETKCQTYNSSDPCSECFECKTGDFLCTQNPQCSCGSALMMVNVMECVPAGEKCAAKDTCCSGMPCIQGYCY